MKKLLILPILLFASMLSALAQPESMDALKADYPQLMAKFGDELNVQRADYIFAIDVSGTMNKYRAVVVPALEAFFRSLQEGDYVSIIKFGGEATNEVGSAGNINPETTKNLIDYAGHIYDTPATNFDKEKYYKWTDLDNMLHYLATDMKQIGRSTLKFVFIITDFQHDASPARRGKEDWAGVAHRFATEQAGNDVYVFALQLPGAGKDLEKVRNVFPESFNFNHVAITNENALSDWFTQRKNAILLDKFYALITHKIQPAEFSIDPSLDIDGNLELGISWNPNPVYDCICIDEVTTSGKSFEFHSRLPETTKTEATALNAGKLSWNGASLFKPCFKTIDTQLTVNASFDVPYRDELSKLGLDSPSMQACAKVHKNLFCYPIPLWLFCLIIALIILYIILVIRAFSRNASDFYRIGGKFEVTNDGEAVTERKAAKNADSVDIGVGAAFLTVPDCNWAITIYVKRYNPFLFFFKSPSYVIRMTKGTGFKANGNKWGMHQTPVVPRYTKITVGAYRIKWIQ